MDDMVKLAENLRTAGIFQDLAPPLQTALFLGLLVFIPVMVVSLTAFTRIVIVLSFVRQAVTTQQLPPATVIIGLSLFLTIFVMGPTLDEIHQEAVSPYLEGKLAGVAAYQRGSAALQKFMLRQTRRQDLALLLHLAKVDPLPTTAQDTPWRVLVPAFMLSELKTAFIMGFCLYVPFLLVDLVVASVLNALGMVTMPPVIISAPFKILLFVVADGWHLVVRALSLSFG